MTIRTPLVRALHRADTLFNSLHRFARGRGLPRQVMFEAANPMLFDVFRPVYERLSADPRVSIILVPYGDEFRTEEIFARASGRDRVVLPQRAAWLKPDVYINTDFWSMTWLHRQPSRVHLFHGVAGKYGLDAPVDVAGAVRTFDRILFPNHDRLNRYVAAGLVDKGSPVGVVTGYPKADFLVNGSLDRRAIAERLRLDVNRPTVIYAPTWSQHSSLNAVGDEIITTLADGDLNLIIKLHACSYVARGSGNVDWRERLRRFAARPNVRVADDADASPYLAVSDLLVTDHSTVGFEFMVLDRPVVVVHQPRLIDQARINPEKVRQLQSAARVIDGPLQLLEAVGQELRNPGRLSAARRRLAGELFYGCGHATDRATAVIYDLLRLTPAVRGEGTRAPLPAFEASRRGDGAAAASSADQPAAF